MGYESRLRRFGARLADRRRAPRKWWYPIYSAPEQGNSERVRALHKETSKILQRTLFAHIAFSFFCAFTLLGSPDKDLVAAGSKLAVPLPLVSDFQMSFAGFLVVGPIVLLGITLYLHVFLQDWRALKRVPADERVPFLFNLRSHSGKMLSYLLFYWSTPAVLAIFSWKTLPLPKLGPVFFYLFALSVAWSLWLQIRRCPETYRSWNVLPWILLVGVAVGAVEFSRLRDMRALDLSKADLSRQDLRARYLVRGNLRKTNFALADLTGATLAFSNLSEADLTGTNLSRADLSGARGLIQAQLNVACVLPPAILPIGLSQPPFCEQPPRPAKVEEETLNRRILIAGGTARVSCDEEPAAAREVQLTDFYIQQHEVTNEEYWRFDPEHDAGAPPRYPVVNVTWAQAAAYAKWLGGDLPSEAQWVFAAEGEQGRPYPWGDKPLTCGRAHYRDCRPGTPVDVMSHPDGATPQGVNDLAGNVWEWCKDSCGPEIAGEGRDLSRLEMDPRVLRGGSFSNVPKHLMMRRKHFPTGWADNFGFRVALPASREPD